MKPKFTNSELKSVVKFLNLAITDANGKIMRMNTFDFMKLFSETHLVDFHEGKQKFIIYKMDREEKIMRSHYLKIFPKRSNL